MPIRFIEIIVFDIRIRKSFNIKNSDIFTEYFTRNLAVTKD